MLNQPENKEKETASDKSITLILIGVALIILSFAFLYIALSEPKVNKTYQYESSALIISSTSENIILYDNENTSSSISESNTYSIQNNSAGTVSSSTKLSVSYPLNLNTCTAEELMTINKIGETRANAIIAYREVLGGYTSVEQIKNISGIGDSIYEAVAPYLTV